MKPKHTGFHGYGETIYGHSHDGGGGVIYRLPSSSRKSSIYSIEYDTFLILQIQIIIFRFMILECIMFNGTLESMI